MDAIKIKPSLRGGTTKQPHMLGNKGMYRNLYWGWFVPHKYVLII
jgi:hypothetical protein